MEKLKAELKEKEGLRKEIAGKIEVAKDKGDLSENAEYHEAKEEQGLNESRIVDIREVLSNAVIANGDGKAESVELGSTIRVKADGGEREFTIVGFNEANPMEGKISNESPLGQAFMSRRKGDEVEVIVPRGKMKYTIIDVK